MEFRNLTRSLFLCLLIPAVAIAQQGIEAKDDELYRWVDNEGNVHYTNTMPAEYSTRPYDIINSEGIVVRRVTDPLNPDEGEEENLPPVVSEEERQRRLDRALLLKYRSETELLETVELFVAQMEFDRRILRSGRASLLESYRGQIRKAGDAQRAGSPVPDSVEGEIQSLTNRLLANDQELLALNEREAVLRERFDEQLTRYQYLRGSPR